MNIFVLTGAGISAESGLGTFRDKGGLWSRFDPMKLATPEAFTRDPAEVHAFYNMRRRNLIGAEPNAAHHGLTRLEAGLAERGGRLVLCTQNIDDLHERAGSRSVVHMHGELLKTRCGDLCDQGKRVHTNDAIAKVSVVVEAKYAELAVRVLHDGFGLDKPPTERTRVA